MGDELNKPHFNPKFQSEFSMGEYDFKRFDIWLGRAELSSAIINSCEVPDLPTVQRYFSELNVLYKSWRSLISIPKITEELDEKINLSKEHKRKWENSLISGVDYNKSAIFQLVDLLDSIHTKLLDIKQKIGLGIVVKKVISTKQKIKYGLNPQHNLHDLPPS